MGSLLLLFRSAGPSTSPNRTGGPTTTGCGPVNAVTHNATQLDVPGKEHGHHRPHSPPKHTGSRKSPKRRPVQRHNIASSSSSTESLVASKEHVAGRSSGKCECRLGIIRL